MAAGSHIVIQQISALGHYFGENISVTHDNGIIQGHLARF